MGTLTDYVPQDAKVVNIRTNLVPGYVTQRWSPRIPWDHPVPYALALCTATVRNLGTETAVLKIQQTGDDSVSGTRTSFGAVAVVAGGTTEIFMVPTQKYVEVKGIYGNGPVGIEIQTKLDWTDESFNVKQDANYPACIMQAEPTTPTASASQTFTLSDTWVVAHNLGFIADPTIITEAGVDITDSVTFSNITTTGYTATLVVPRAGTAYSTK